jgi:peptidoglycan/LPS O-acetylase OafA/YrhL
LPASQRLPSLDGLRAVSIALVIGSHALGMFELPSWLQPFAFIVNGNLGVRIFFCISGFLITYLLLQERKRTGSIDLKAFYIRRALRIFPANYLFIAVLATISFADWTKIPTCNLLTALTYTKNYGCDGPLEGHLWSLGVEEQFYLLWPFAVVYCNPRRALAIACLLCFIAPISRAAEYVLGNSPFTWLPSNADGLMVGAALAYVAALRPNLLKVFFLDRGWERLFCVCAMLLPDYLGTRVMLGKFTVTVGPTLQVVAITWLIGSVTFGKAPRLLNVRPTIYVGLISYSLYI